MSFLTCLWWVMMQSKGTNWSYSLWEALWWNVWKTDSDWSQRFHSCHSRKVEKCRADSEQIFFFLTVVSKTAGMNSTVIKTQYAKKCKKIIIFKSHQSKSKLRKTYLQRQVNKNIKLHVWVQTATIWWLLSLLVTEVSKKNHSMIHKRNCALIPNISAS